MSLRVVILFVLVVGFAFYAWRNWFVSLCAAVILMAFGQHPDVPRNIAGIQGLNFWNFLIFNIVLSWWLERKALELTWDCPPKLMWLFLAFVLVVMWSSLRLLLDHGRISPAEVISEYFVNTLKYLIPGILFFDGCRTRQRVKIALVVIVALYFFLALQVIKVIPLGLALEGGEKMAERAARLLARRVGYHRVSLSVMLAGASWAALAAGIMLKKKWHRIGFAGGAVVILMGQALTGGRTGYVTFGAIGFLMCLVRWRKFLPLVPVSVLAVLILLPSVRERMLLGFGGTGRSGEKTDLYDVSSGRNLIWPLVIEKIKESPVIGYGRLGMVRTGLADRIFDELNEIFGHPHNAYLEMLLDNGILGFLLAMPLFGVVVLKALRLFADRGDPLRPAVGGVAIGLVLGWMLGCLGAVTFYPYEFSMGMWAVIGLLFRMSTSEDELTEQASELETNHAREAYIASMGDEVFESV